MLSDSLRAALYCVEVRFAGEYREQVAELEFADFWDAKQAAHQLDRWLKRGHCHGLPESVLDLPAELERMGFDPRRAMVWVAELPAAGPGAWDTRPAAEVLVIDCTDPDDDDDQGDVDTVVIVDDVPQTTAL